MNKNIEAIECFDQAISMYPSYAESFKLKGNTLQAMKQFSQAIECFDKAFGIDSKYAEAFLGKGIVLYYMKRYTETIECNNIVIDINHSNVADALVNKENALAKLKKHIKTIEYDI